MYKNGERMMAWIAKIAEVSDIPNADSICAYRVGGWWVVDKKNAYNMDDLCVYVSIDSWIPHDLAPFLSKGKEPREFNGVKGERLRTVRLRGQISQGLLLPLGIVPPIDMSTWNGMFEGTDVSDMLGIQKWEAPIPAQLAGIVRGPFPTEVPKTDQERIQNLVTEYEQWKEEGDTWEVTEKLDGSSCTFYLDRDGDFHVCSRNLDLKQDEKNSLWKVAIRYDVENRLKEREFFGFAIQGELIGEGIQGNPYGIKGQDFYVFDMYDVKTGGYVSPETCQLLCEAFGLNHVPVLSKEETFKTHVGTVQHVLAWAEGKSVLNPKTEREGLVFKRQDGAASFKAISNLFLLREK